MKILVLKPSSLGDVLQAIPVLRLLKQHDPAAEIFWWVDSALASLLEGDPDLAGVLHFERQRWGKPRHWPEMIRSIRDLRARKFDLVIDLQSLARSAAFAWLARGHFLVGLDEVREGARGFYDLAARRPTFHTHAVDWYLSVLPLIGVPVHSRFVWLPERPGLAAAVKSKWPVATGARWVALQPGARWDNKRWPAESFAELVRQVSLRFPDTRFAILGSGGDKPLGEIIARAAPARCLNLCGQTSLPEMIEWVRLSDLMITNDTGPMHAAAALGKPVIALFGPTDPRRTGPYGQLENVLRIELPCSPCLSANCSQPAKWNDCLMGLPVALVVNRVARLLPPDA